MSRGASKAFLRALDRSRQEPKADEFFCSLCRRLMKRGPYGCGQCGTAKMCQGCRNRHACELRVLSLDAAQRNREEGK